MLHVHKSMNFTFKFHLFIKSTHTGRLYDNKIPFYTKGKLKDKQITVLTSNRLKEGITMSNINMLKKLSLYNFYIIQSESFKCIKYAF